MRRSTKVPRARMEKFLQGGAAGRRTTVATVGDSLRALGVVRLEGSVTAGDIGGGDDLRQLAGLVLEALEEYFGLECGALAGLVEEGVGPVVPESGGSGAARQALLALWRGPAVGSLEALLPGGSALPVGAREGEVVVFSGGALATLTRGVVPKGSWRIVDQERSEPMATRSNEVEGLFLVAPPATHGLQPLREFGARDGGIQRK